MAGKTDVLEEEWLDYWFRAAAAPTVVDPAFMGLFVTNPSDDGTGGVEASYGGYKRISVTRAAGSWTDPSAGTQGEIDNVGKIAFPPSMDGADLTVNGIGIFDALTAGILYWFGSLTGAPVTISPLEQPVFDIGDLNIQED